MIEYNKDMVRHLFLDKTATIVRGSLTNTGLNPIIDLNYGVGVSRALLHFDETMIKEMVDDKTIADIDKMTCTLKMTNCESVDGVPYEKHFLAGEAVMSQRAASYELILFKLPQYFDEGRGFEFTSDFWIRNNRSYSIHGANWFYSNDGMVWQCDEDKVDLTDPMISIKDGVIWKFEPVETKNDGFKVNNENCEGEIIPDGTVTETKMKKTRVKLDGGVYTDERLKEEYEKYENGEESIIVGVQHFDFGCENLSIDITDYVKSIISGACNYGLGIAFAPYIEKLETTVQQHVGFFGVHTNTFFHPYVEIVNSEYINDNRENFYIGRKNNLYLYTNVDGYPTNLDNLPVCNIDGIGKVDVKQVGKGVYCAQITLSKNDVEEDTILYDTWSGLAVNGQEFDDVEMEVVTISSKKYLSAGSSSVLKNNVVPSFEGVNNGENLKRGEIREVVVDFRKEYTTDKKELIDGGEYRIYVKDGNRELDVIDYQPIEKAFLNNFFIIYTDDLVPNNEYFVDVRIRFGRETKYYKKALRFSVVSDVTERYE